MATSISGKAENIVILERLTDNVSYGVDFHCSTKLSHLSIKVAEKNTVHLFQHSDILKSIT